MCFGVKFAEDLNFAVLGKGRISRQRYERDIFIFVHLTINREPTGSGLQPVQAKIPHLMPGCQQPLWVGD